MLPPLSDYAALYARFAWDIPPQYNIARDGCFRWAETEGSRTAIIEVFSDGRVAATSYAELRALALSLAAALARRGVQRGDRVAILLPQMREVAVAHLATYALGAVAVPLAALFGVDAIAYRLRDSGAKVLITNAAGLTKRAQAEGEFAALELEISTDGAQGAALDWHQLIAEPLGDFTPVKTSPDDPAMMIYTSGTTGAPKGALHGHRVVLGHLPGVQMPHEHMPQPGDRLWTPADWAWAGGLLNILLPGLHFGLPVIARKFEKFDPEEALAMMAAVKVRNTFIPPTALRMLRSVRNIRGRFALELRSLASGGESLGAETFAWGLEAFGLPINEFYGQTECNLVLASAAGMGVSKPGCIGKPVPGHRVAVISPEGAVLPPGALGEIAVARPDPVMFLSYWKRPDAMAAKFIGDWMRTGDQGIADAEGYIRFVGRDDDVITSAGYRIGPTEIEDCLIRHPAVALAAVVGKPDALRTEIVKAFIVLRSGTEPSPELAKAIQAYVRERLSAHEYPREITFVDSLPMTTTGKVIRRLLREQA